MHKSILSLLLFFCVGSVSAGVHIDAINVSFPDQLAGFRFAETSTFPVKELGDYIAYRRSDPILASIYIYTAGISPIPASIDAPVVKQHFSQIIAEAKGMETSGQARSVNLTTGFQQNTHYFSCGPQFIWREFEFENAAGTNTSYTYLTTMKNNFVKLRITHQKDDVQARSKVETFVVEIRKLLGNCKD
ncbi:MAG: hypothetical protein HYR68_07645 [Burkholderiales bacterium]|nr:hypothetical protein [Burkholderiales bacterium]MBI3726837.1 hypothetical protein [Burkholderiales bacterium]